MPQKKKKAPRSPLPKPQSVPFTATRWRREPESGPVPQPTALAGFPSSLRMKAQVLRVAHQALHDPPRHSPALPSFALGLPHRNGSQESQPGTGPSLAFRGTRPADDDLGAAPWPEAYRQQAAGQGLALGCWAHKVTLDHGEGLSSGESDSRSSQVRGCQHFLGADSCHILLLSTAASHSHPESVCSPVCDITSCSLRACA